MITISANLAKKTPLSGIEYASHQASITITAEASDLSQIPAEARRLFQIAEAAVDLQLGLAEHSSTERRQVAESSSTMAAPHHSASAPGRTQAGSSASANSGPSRPYSNARRSTAPITDNQVSYLGRLISETRTDLSAILHDYQVGSLHQLTAQQGSKLIDQLKAGATA